MDREEIKKLFIKGIDCSQVVTGHFAEVCGIDEKSMRKVAACFGGGMQCGETCGAVTGALMVIGMKYGSLFDATQTMVAEIGNGLYEVQVVAWYDNENSYTSQMVRTIKYFAELK